MAQEGSSGVENTLRIRTLPPSTHTQSVNVPPVSMASGKNFDAKRETARGMRTGVRSQDQQKRDSSTRKHCRPPPVAESLDNDADHCSENHAHGEDGRIRLGNNGTGETEQQAKEQSKQPT